MKIQMKGRGRGGERRDTRHGEEGETRGDGVREREDDGAVDEVDVDGSSSGYMGEGGGGKGCV